MYGFRAPPEHSESSRPSIFGDSPVHGGRNEWGGFRKGGSCNNRFVLKPNVAIANKTPISSKNSLAITDFLVKKTQPVNYCETPLLGTPYSRFPIQCHGGWDRDTKEFIDVTAAFMGVFFSAMGAGQCAATLGDADKANTAAQEIAARLCLGALA